MIGSEDVATWWWSVHLLKRSHSWWCSVLNRWRRIRRCRLCLNPRSHRRRRLSGGRSPFSRCAVSIFECWKCCCKLPSSRCNQSSSGMCWSQFWGITSTSIKTLWRIWLRAGSWCNGVSVEWERIVTAVLFSHLSVSRRRPARMAP